MMKDPPLFSNILPFFFSFARSCRRGVWPTSVLEPPPFHFSGRRVFFFRQLLMPFFFWSILSFSLFHWRLNFMSFQPPFFLSTYSGPPLGQGEFSLTPSSATHRGHYGFSSFLPHVCVRPPHVCPPPMLLAIGDRAPSLSRLN